MTRAHILSQDRIEHLCHVIRAPTRPQLSCSDGRIVPAPNLSLGTDSTMTASISAKRAWTFAQRNPNAEEPNTRAHHTFARITPYSPHLHRRFQQWHKENRAEPHVGRTSPYQIYRGAINYLTRQHSQTLIVYPIEIKKIEKIETYKTRRKITRCKK